MGIFCTMEKSNDPQQILLKQWSLDPRGVEIKVFVPAGSIHKYEGQQIEVLPFSIPFIQWMVMHGVSFSVSMRFLLWSTSNKSSCRARINA
jgi:hypothetical protein